MGVLFQNDFDHSALEHTAHRPYPKPESAWVMTQTWHDLLFLHWPVDQQMLAALLPVGLDLDTYGGQAYVTLAPFHMTNVAPRGVPAVPGISSMAELNVRTYVTAKNYPGVFFFSLDASSAMAVGAARTMYYLPYFTAKMRCEERAGWMEYESTRTPSKGAAARFAGRYRGVGAARYPEKGTLEYFLTERYCLFTLDDALHLYRADIHHGPWPLALADAEIDENTMMDAAGIRLPTMTPLAHFAKRQDVVVWPLTRMDQAVPNP